MAAEATLSASLDFDSGTIAGDLAKSGLRLDCSATAMIEHVQTVSTTAEAITLGDCAAPGHYLAINLDNTNFVTLQRATGEAAFAEMEAKGGFACFKWASGATAPFIKADTASCRVQYLLLNRS